MPKTGSNSIQESLRRTPDLGPGHHYVDLGMASGNASRPLVTAFADEPWRDVVNHRRGLGEVEVREQGEAIRSRLAAEIAAGADRTSVISAEAVCRFSEPALANLTRTLEGMAGSVRAVGYIRPPDGFMESGFQQRLQGGLDRLDPNELYPKYMQFKAFDRVLGRERVALWKFEPARFPGGCVVRDFCARLGIEIPDGRIVRVNESLSRPAASILLAYRRYGPGYGVGRLAIRENRAVIEALREVSGPRLRFADSIVEPALEANAEDLAWLEERLGEELSVKPAAGEAGISSEDDLLEVEAPALQTFLDVIQRRSRIELPGVITSRIDTDPHAVAQTVQACRDAIRDKLLAREAAVRRRRRRRLTAQRARRA